MEKNNVKLEGKKKQSKALNPFLILMSVVVICAIASYFVTPGAFDRQVVDGRTIVVPGSFHSVEKTPVSFFDIFRAVPEGFVGAASIMFLVMLVGGFVKIYSETGALDHGISKIVKLSDKVGSAMILVIIMVMFTLIGGFLGWAEQIIPFVPLIISICLSLGYDSLVGMASSAFVCMMAFAVSPTNFYTVGISHEIAELPMFSGMAFRLIALVVIEAVIMIYILKYAAKIKKDPTKSLVHGVDMTGLQKDYSSHTKMTGNQVGALVVFGLTFVIAIYGVLKYEWSMNDLSAIFVLGAIVGGIVGRLGANGIVSGFVEGAKGSLEGAMVIGIARSIQIVLEKGGLIDPAINALSTILSGLSPVGAAIGIFVVTIIADGIIPSGSGKAIAIMPILIPLADMIGITRQTTTLAYQFGDGFANMYWFTNGTLLIFLALARVPLKSWYKFLWKLQILLTIIAVVFLSIAVKIGYGPF